MKLPATTLYSEAVITNWEVKNGDGSWVSGIENPEGGDPLPFNHRNVLDAFEALPDLFLDIKEQAENAAMYRANLREEAEKFEEETGLEYFF